MSETPDFIGQKFTDSNTGNVWNANSTTPGDWSLQVQNMMMEWQPTSVKLADFIGLFTYGDLPGITDIIFKQASSLAGFDLESIQDLVTLSFPNLVSIDPINTQGGYFFCFVCNNLTTLSMPVLVSVAGNWNCQQNPALASVDLSSLATVGGNLFCISNGVTSFLVPNLTSVTNALFVNTNTSLASISFPSLLSVGGSIQCTGNTILSSLSFPSLTSAGTIVNCSGSALNVASINGILAQLVSIPTWGNAGQTLNLSGGTNAAPSGQGVTDKNTLIARGAAVTTN